MERPHILGRPTLRLIQRFTAAGNSGPIAAPAGFSRQQAFLTPFLGQGIQSLQAFRVIQGWALLNATVLPAAAANLQAPTFNIFIFDNPKSLNLRAYSSLVTNNSFGTGGLLITIPDSDFILASDFAEQGGIAQDAIQVLCQADISNTTAGALNIAFSYQISVEVYQADIYEPREIVSEAQLAGRVPTNFLR